MWYVYTICTKNNRAIHTPNNPKQSHISILFSAVQSVAVQSDNGSNIETSFYRHLQFRVSVKQVRS